MKTKSKPPVVFALALGLALAGCQSRATRESNPAGNFPAALDGPFGGYASAKLNGIRIGMTREEVQSVLGPPDSKAAQANVEYMIYYLDSDPYTRDRTYMIRMLNGRVESFGRFAELLDLYGRPVANPVPGQSNFPQPAYYPANPRLAAPPVGGGYSQRSAADLATELAKLKALEDQGALTPGEFEKAKAKLLSQP